MLSIKHVSRAYTLIVFVMLMLLVGGVIYTFTYVMYVNVLYIILNKINNCIDYQTIKDIICFV